MQISTISTVAPLASATSVARTSSAKSTSATGTLTTAGAPTSVSASSPVGKSTAPTNSASIEPKSGSGQSFAPPQSEAAAVNTATSTLESSSYSTSVGGKSYSANISQANGTYTLSVPNLPGASVSGSSLSAAESALSVKIDTLV